MSRDTTCCSKVWCQSALPALQFVSTSTVVSVVRMLLFGKDDHHDTQAASWACSSLLKLPCADSIDSSQLCSLLTLALDKHAFNIIEGLAE